MLRAVLNMSDRWCKTCTEQLQSCKILSRNTASKFVVFKGEKDKNILKIQPTYILWLCNLNLLLLMN